MYFILYSVTSHQSQIEYDSEQCRYAAGQATYLTSRMLPKQWSRADTANCVDHDQTAPMGAV